MYQQMITTWKDFLQFLNTSGKQSPRLLFLWATSSLWIVSVLGIRISDFEWKGDDTQLTLLLVIVGLISFSTTWMLYKRSKPRTRRNSTTQVSTTFKGIMRNVLTDTSKSIQRFKDMSPWRMISTLRLGESLGFLIVLTWTLMGLVLHIFLTVLWAPLVLLVSKLASVRKRFNMLMGTLYLAIHINLKLGIERLREAVSRWQSM